MKFGIFDHIDSSGAPLHEHLENRLRMVEVYDRCGIHGYHVAEHHGTPLGLAPSPSVYLAAVAQRTKRIRFGPLIYMMSLYHPVRLIEEVCMLDHLSKGRFMLGMGKGVSPIEIGFYGHSSEEAEGRYQETREILLRGLTEKTVDFSGNFFKLTRVPMIMRPYQKPHPELWYGLRTPQRAIWAAQNDINVVTIGLAAVTRQMTDLYRQEWARLGKPSKKLPLMGVSRHIVVAETDTEARKIARAAYRRWRESFANLWVAHGFPVPMKDIYPPDWDGLQALGNGCAGAPETVRRYIEEEAQRGGINYFVGWFAFGDMTLAQVTRSMELFSARVMPAFAGESTHNRTS